MTADRSRNIVERGANAVDVAEAVVPRMGVTLGAWLDQIGSEDSGLPHDEPPSQIDGRGSQPEEEQQARAPERLAAENSNLADVAGPSPVSPAPMEIARRLQELEDAMATAVSGMRTEVGEVYQELGALNSETREVVAGALGRLARRVEHVEALNAEAHNTFRGALAGLDERLEFAESELDNVAAFRGLAQLVERLSGRLETLENAQINVAVKDDVREDFDDLFERDEQRPHAPTGEDRAADWRRPPVEVESGRVSSLARARLRRA